MAAPECVVPPRAVAATPARAPSGAPQPAPDALDRVTRLACRLLDAPVAYVALADGAMQVVSGGRPLPQDGMRPHCDAPPGGALRSDSPRADSPFASSPLAGSLCARVMSAAQPVLCGDLAALADGPADAMLAHLGACAAAAVPVLRASGRPVGCLCAVDVRPRRWADADAELLADLAAAVTSELELAAAAADVEERRHAEGAWRAAERALRRSEASYRLLMEEASDGLCVADAATHIVAVNAAFAALVDAPREALVGVRLGELFAPASESAPPLRLELLRPGESALREQWLRRRDGASVAVEVSARMLPDGRLQAIVRDITARARREAVQRFLDQAGERLGQTLDYQATLSSLARLAVPTLADWCVVYTRESDDTITRLHVTASDPEKLRLLQTLCAIHPIARDTERSAAARVIRTGRAELLREVPASYPEEAATSPEHLALLRALDFRSTMLVPLTARGRTLGAVMFATAESGRRYGPEDLALAVDLGRRAALAMDNALLYSEAQAARAATEAASGAKSDFLAVMSHELRTPLSAIIGYSELLADGITGPVSAAQHDQLGRIRTCAGHLLGLIDEILAFARLETERDEVRTDLVDVAATVRVAAAVVESAAAEKGLLLRVHAAEGVTVETDAGKVGRILVNLLSNAIKFTHAGEITCTAAVTSTRLELTVSDTGIGIDPAHHQRIFERFWQVEPPVRRHAGGTGIGLAVAQRLARLLGGEITLESAPGRGSQFTVRLPLPARSAVA